MAKKIIAIILLITVIIFTSIGCTKNKNTLDHLDDIKDQESSNGDNTKDNSQTGSNDEDLEDNEVDNQDKSDNTEDQEEDTDEASEEDEIEIIVSGVPSPLSGIRAPEDKVARRPVAVMIDNHPKARWQAGLGQAEVIYEFKVEHPYTRYMAIFLINDPEEIGPIRSSRPYFVTALLEYDPVYVRVGGSDAAYAYIDRLNLADIDGIYSGGFWRVYDTGKEAPNNMYSSMAAIRKRQKSRGFRLYGNYEGFKFYEKDTDLEGTEASVVTIHYNNNNTTKYVFNEQDRVYLRYKDGKLHVDELDNSPIVAKNIIIQKAKTKVIDNDGRLSIDIIGSGKGYYITNGKAINITWEKSSEKSKTKYYNENGEEIIFNVGQTWIQVVPLNPDIEIR